MKDYLQNRLQRLEAAEKEAWAQLNFVLGSIKEVKMLASFMSPGGPVTETSEVPSSKE